MKARLTARAALAFGMRSLARDALRLGRASRRLFVQARKDAGQGSRVSTALLVCLMLVGL
ncbi:MULTISPECIES: hypothetical protein [Methylorubrum]|uniref:hypothetical protein n=1 Tax=Methylorubrum TaxID=2282523 RepID=UPI00209E4061|nr:MULTISPECIES: hypothetical protein [Methylorubrum]MCP1551667.1 hypothetical protein [Methylorubrum zatmanii]MCP1556595.1 hypothetical protein [Methylorubrum extorquens]MCP1582002.1 hypothetical protein [Methylorubrum extorquens]